MHPDVGQVTATRVAKARDIAPVACVQNLHNLAHSEDDALQEAPVADGIAYGPYLPQGRFSPLRCAELPAAMERLAITPPHVALAQHPGDPGHLVCRPPARDLAAAALADDAAAALDDIGGRNGRTSLRAGSATAARNRVMDR